MKCVLPKSQISLIDEQLGRLFFNIVQVLDSEIFQYLLDPTFACSVLKTVPLLKLLRGPLLK